MLMFFKKTSFTFQGWECKAVDMRIENNTFATNDPPVLITWSTLSKWLTGMYQFFSKSWWLFCFASWILSRVYLYLRVLQILLTVISSAPSRQFKSVLKRCMFLLSPIYRWENQGLKKWIIYNHTLLSVKVITLHLSLPFTTFPEKVE